MIAHRDDIDCFCGWHVNAGTLANQFLKLIGLILARLMLIFYAHISITRRYIFFFANLKFIDSLCGQLNSSPLSFDRCVQMCRKCVYMQIIMIN